MNIEKIEMPKNYIVNDSFVEKIFFKNTEDKCGFNNGYIVPIVNSLIPNTKPIGMIYLSICKPGRTKGPYMHENNKYDRFVCVKGSCIIVSKNEQTGKYLEFELNSESSFYSLLTIPPYNSHLIISKEGCTILSIPTEGYYPGYYNQIETNMNDYDQGKRL